jgi:hypothetical protein
MPTVRRKIAPKRIDQPPQCALDLLAGKRPRPELMAGWLFFNDRIEGLPEARSAEGEALLRDAGYDPSALKRRKAR